MTLYDDKVYRVSFNENEIIFGDSKGNLYNTLQKLLKKPAGKWYSVGQFDAKSSANATITAITQGKRPIPSGVFEFTARCPSKDSSEIYARWIPE